MSYGQRTDGRPVAVTQNLPAKQIIKTDQAPQPVGPYSQGVLVDGFLFVAGQVGVNPQTRQLVTDSFEAEATQVIENLQAILRHSQSCLHFERPEVWLLQYQVLRQGFFVRSTEADYRYRGLFLLWRCGVSA